MADVTASQHNFSRYLAAPADSARQARLATLLAPLVAELRQMGGDAGKPEKMAAAMAALRGGLGEEDVGLELLTLYLQLWIMDIEAAERYTAARVRFDVSDPPADFWYQRIDTRGSHDFFQDGIYLTNTIPAASVDYYNSEIYNGTQTKQQPRNVIANLFSVDSATDPINSFYDLFLNAPFVPCHGLEMSTRLRVDNLPGGSRGWGFWNTSVLPPLMQVAWFIQFNGEGSGGVKPFYDNGFYAITQNGLGYSAVKLCDLDEAWHDYRIWIGDGAVHYFIDGACVASVTDRNTIPSSPMAFHNWVDNSLFGWDSAEKVIKHIPQTTYGPRSNFMQSVRIRSLP
jgi:hypothetical protein